MKVEANGWWDDGMARDEELENMLSSILDFPMESLEGDDWDTTNSLHLGPIPMDVLFQAPDQPPNWFGDGAENKSAHARSHSPVSVLETTVSSKSLLFKSGIVKRARSKRARPSGVSPWLLLPPVFADANKTKERRKKSPCLPMAKQTMESSDCTAQARPTKKCTHCEITKTPQWREGPLGPKTLCNACGVRYRSGRLFPEYRPVASPTFVPSLHSNSHKKVIEMRNKGKHRVAEVC